MKSIAGSIVVLAGAVVLGLAHEDIPDEAFPTLSSLGLIVVGLILVFVWGVGASGGKGE